MMTGRLKRNLAFIVPTLSEVAAQNEDIVQLLIYAAARLEQEITVRTDRNVTVTIISVERDRSGWKHLSSLFPPEALKHVSVEELEKPVTPNLGFGSHIPAYDLFEFLKGRAFDEVHCLDHRGLSYYPTLARQLGFYFLETVFAVHVVGGTIFRLEVEDQLLDDVEPLVDDLLERGSLERADASFVHDHKAWLWYSDKIGMRSDAKVIDLAWPQPTQQMTPEPAPLDPDQAVALVYYGSLGTGDGLPLFCDVVERTLPQLERPVEVVCVGSPQAMGGLDAISYIRLRSAKWKVPVTIKREFSIMEELAYLFDLQGIVFCDTVRRESLRARLVTNSGLPLLHVKQANGIHPESDDKPYPVNPGRIAQTLVDMVSAKTLQHPRPMPELPAMWQVGRPSLPDLKNITPSPALPLRSGDEPKVSVCVTHYCRPHKLRRALASLRTQTYINFEVIVIDDGSRDPDVRNELAKIRQEIEPLGWRLLVQENRYLGAARNYGASQATGDYLLFMDDDNAAKPNELSTLVAVAQRTGADIVTTFYDAFETDGDLTSEKPPRLRFTPVGADPALGAFTNCFGDANALYSRRVFDQLGGFTEDYGITHEDWELFCRASLEGVKMVCVPEPLFWYRVDPAGMFRGQQTQLHKSANLRRHIRPYLGMLPYYQAKLVQLAQGLTTELPIAPVGSSTRAARPRALKARHEEIPYARVAVIMRTKDRPLLLRRAVRSVLGQTFKDWLLVIVNDGGDPAGIELVVDEVAEELADQVLVLHHPISFGMQTASNAAISRCDSDFIIIHDDDDSWKPNFLARTVTYLDERGWNPRLGGVVTWSQVLVEELGEEGEVKVHNRYIFNDNLYNISLLDLAVENRFPPISFLFRRAALDTVGPFREQHGVLGDWEFHLRLLQRFNIDVIPEPLANYHHRTQSTEGVYGNSVHAQNSLHHSRRVDLHNNVLREELSNDNGFSLAQLLAFGDLQKTMLEKQSQEFQELHDYIWTIENKINSIPSQVNNSAKTKRRRNLVRNGDFRLWSEPRMTIKSPGDKYAYSEICPGFLVCYDGRQVSYRVERRKWTEDGYRAPYGKTYLHLENDGHTKGGSWFNVECIIPSVLLLSGQKICISGLGYLKGRQDWIFIGGRYELGDGRELTWPDQLVSLPTDFERWTYSMTCPIVQETEVSRGHLTRILLKLPPNQPFEFDLTNFQVELGSTPTEFEYNEDFSLREWFHISWNKMKMWRKKARQTPRIANSRLETEFNA